MAVRRRTAAGAAAVGILAVAVVPGLPAHAHGAPISPLSRTAACAEAADTADSAACRAALAANDGPFGTFDNLRVPGIGGRDRELIPDGQLCSAGLDAYRGLDLPREDWPATTLAAGATLDMRYRTTIPHPGSFRMYLTTPGYDPAQPLRWDDLTTRPLVTVKEPPLRDGSYRMSVSLPPNRTGRHLLYTVWQTTDSTDTYYSCSDLVLTTVGNEVVSGGGPATATPDPAPPVEQAPPAGGREPAAVAQPEAAPPAAGDAAAAEPVLAGGGPPERESWLRPTLSVADESVSLGQRLVTTALVVLVGVAGALAFLRMRTARAQRSHRSAKNR